MTERTRRLQRQSQGQNRITLLWVGVTVIMLLLLLLKPEGGMARQAGLALGAPILTAAPDLIAVSVQSPPLPVVTTANVFTVTVRNQGDQAASAFRVDLYLDHQPSGGGDLAGIASWVTALAAGDVVTLTTPPIIVTSGGMHQLWVQADTLGAVPESVESNNTLGPVELRVASFVDVPVTHPSWDSVERLKAAGVTAGCSITPPMFCPDATVQRDQIAVFIDRAEGWAPTPGVNRFSDLAADNWATPFVETLRAHEVTAGCGANPLRYCPTQVLSKAEIATMIRAASGWAPATPQHIFADAGLAGSWAEPHIEAFYAHTPGSQCGANDQGQKLFCPWDPVTRSYMAELLVSAFSLGSPPTPTPTVTASPTAATPTLTPTATATSVADSPNPPANPVKLIFVHHSTGGNWLADQAGNALGGGLGRALMDNNYFVSATNYGWTVAGDAIGSRTDIGNWWEWFRGPNSAGVEAALYGENGQNIGGFGAWPRLAADPGGENRVIVFKSCFPNSALQGDPGAAPPPISSNPLRTQSASSQYHTVANAKGIYIDLLAYFRTRPDKLFVVITAPPLQDATWAANARAFNNWLVNDWLTGYPYRNVAVFDYYNVLTSNGGDAATSDLGWTSGNHHRWWNGAVQRLQTVAKNTLAYPSGDDHPNRLGNEKATAEFVRLLNVFYNRWLGAN